MQKKFEEIICATRVDRSLVPWYQQRLVWYQAAAFSRANEDFSILIYLGPTSRRVPTYYPYLYFSIFVPGPQIWNTCSLTHRRP
jgi:hypothetical protein